MRTVLFIALAATLFTHTAVADDKPGPQVGELRKWIGKWSGKGSITSEGKTHQVTIDRKSTRLNSSHLKLSRMPSSA